MDAYETPHPKQMIVKKKKKKKHSLNKKTIT